jgi:flagellar motor switch protein FliM
MAEVLSQNEIDALLAAVSSGNVETEDAEANKAKGASTDWIAYDITSHEKFVRGRLIGLQGIHERFSRMFRTTLSNTLKKNVSVNCTNTDFIRFGDYLSNIMLPATLTIVDMANVKGVMIFVMSSKLAYALVDAYYGGSERPFSKIGGREEFTAIENTLVQKICRQAVRDMEEAWKANYPLKLNYNRSEGNPHFVGGIHGSEMVAVVTFEVEFENLSGPFIAILQIGAFDSLHEYLSTNVNTDLSGDSNHWRQHWMNELMGTEVNLKVELGGTSKTLTEVSHLKKGDILTLKQDSASPLFAFVEGVPKLTGLMGVCRGNAALRITDFYDEPTKNRVSTKTKK